MLSKIAGHTFGVAKKANPVIVRVPRRNGGFAIKEDYLEAISKVVDDVKNRGRGKSEWTEKSVINLSIYYPKDELNDAWIARVKLLLKELVLLGVSPIAGSGNKGEVSLVTK